MFCLSRMAYFEVKGMSLSWQQLTRQIQAHYTHQAIQQAYVLIFGLDVLGNPYGLIKDFTQGFGDLFYEPFLVSMKCFLFVSLLFSLGFIMAPTTRTIWGLSCFNSFSLFWISLICHQKVAWGILYVIYCLWIYLWLHYYSYCNNVLLYVLRLVKCAPP